MNSQEILDKIIKVEQSKELTQLGLDSLKNNDFDGALSHVNKALELNPKNVLALQLRALSKCLLVAKSNTISLNDEVQIREVTVDLTEAINLTDEILRISKVITSTLDR